MQHFVFRVDLPGVIVTAELSGKLLKKSWQGSESGQQRNEALSYLLKY